MPAGHIANSLKLQHRLREADLVTVRRDGRSMIYSARYQAMNALISYLTDNCCHGRPENCAPKSAVARRKAERVR
jgi:DNA-binding transcriptional ArsR family regulator